MFRRTAVAMLALSTTFIFGSSLGCKKKLQDTAIGTTTGIMQRAQPGIKQESDYHIAYYGIPGTLKTVEGFHYAKPSQTELAYILAEGYCQYGSGFVEDDWEMALVEKRFEDAAMHSKRATKMFTRCMGYALEILGSNWKELLQGGQDPFEKKLAKAGSGSREALLWLGMGLASAINQNKDNIPLVAHLSKAKAIFHRILEIQEKSPASDKVKRALPHLVMGMMHTAMGKAIGGKPEEGKVHFEKVFEITENKFLLAKVYYARKYAVVVQDRELFHKTLVEVLQTDPAIWPEQRLANEIAHRRARRYLKMEKELF